MGCLNDNEASVRNAAASAVSAIARIEVPIHLWNDLVDCLNGIIQDPSVRLEVKVTCVETMRYICEDLDPDDMDPTMANAILMGLLYCLQSTMPPEMRNEAIQALNAALYFGDSFMASSENSNRVLESICSCCSDGNPEIAMNGFICLNVVFDAFYTSLGDAFGALYPVAKQAIASGEATVSIQASLALETLALVEKERSEAGEPAAGYCARFGADLVATLCLKMTQQEEEDGETMTPPIAAATCLGAFCELMGNGMTRGVLMIIEVVPIVWPFVSANIGSSDWHLQEAALMIFGCLLRGPDAAFMAPMVAEAAPMLCSLVLEGSNLAVCDSAAWVLSQVCEGHLPPSPRSRRSACWRRCSRDWTCRRA